MTQRNVSAGPTFQGALCELCCAMHKQSSVSADDANLLRLPGELTDEDGSREHTNKYPGSCHISMKLSSL